MRLLTEVRSLRYLRPFLHGVHTLTTAAAALEVAPSTLSPWIGRFRDAGLVAELAPHRRGGMPMRRYRAVARSIVLPWAAIPIDRRIALLDEGRYRNLRRFLDGLDEVMDRTTGGLGFAASGSEAVAITVVDDGVPQRWTDAWTVLRLTTAEAQELAQELEALLARYAGRSAGRQHVVHAGIAPMPRHRWRSVEDS